MLEVSSTSILSFEAQTFSPKIEEMVNKINSSAELAGEYLWLALETRFSGQQFMGQKKMGDLSVRLFSNRFRFVSSYSMWSLKAWLNQEIPLVLYHRIPNPLEVLSLQATGQRCVSALYQKEQISQLILGKKDYLDFFLHDLEHAYKFYHNNKFYHGQVGFYKLLLQAMQAGYFSEVIESNLREAFDYVISDMNSHPVHLMKCLKMIMLKFFEEEKLLTKIDFLCWFNQLLDLWQVQADVRLCFLKLNEADFAPIADGLLLESFFLK